MKILHFILDEKFPDSAYELFEAVAPGQSTYMLAGKRRPLRNLKKIDPVRVSKCAFLDKQFIKSLASYDAIILHSLYPFSIEVLARIHPRMPVVWIGMGYDYYDLVTESADSLLEPKTYKVLNSTTSRKLAEHLKASVKSVLSRFLYPNASQKKELIKKIDLFAPVLQSEYSLVRRKLGEPFPKYIRWNYNKIADLLDGKLGARTTNGKNILVGNSATATNNHIDTFHLIAKTGVPKQSKIIVPLSYGSTQYREKVINEGKRLFGSQFYPVIEFMSLDEYIDLLASCSTVVMSHIRQQAAGNLFIALYLGTSVYLDPRNPLYDEFSSMGLTVSTLSEINSQNLGVPLDPVTAGSHRRILKKERGRDASERHTKSLVDELTRLKHEKTT